MRVLRSRRGRRIAFQLPLLPGVGRRSQCFLRIFQVLLHVPATVDATHLRLEGHRLAGQWVDSGTSFAAIQARYGIGNTDWNFLGEYRWLKVDDGGVREGALFGVDRDITKNFRVGIGYNFTDFSDDLTNFDYDHKGWFLNVVGRY